MKTEKVYIEYLLLQAQRGHSSALDKLIPIVQQKLMNYTRRLMRNAADAEDCVQETMLVMLTKYSQVRDVKAFLGWLFKVVNNKCQDRWRQQQRELNHAEHADVIQTQPTESALPESDASPLLDIKMAMAQLAEPHLSVIYLFYFEGFKVAEIAAILDKPAGTIKSDLFDARNGIKKFLNQE